MAYQALYRKYRPASFDQVFGQKHIVQTLKNAIEKNRIAHAYLFCGPRGTGKTSIAKIFARTLNCTGEHKPCMECENCRLSLEGSHPDIIEIDAASNNGVDEVRSLIDRIGYAPMEGKYKVYIIDEVHMMTSGAFNALLKTIEEPTAHVIFIFATTEPHKVLPTILSRCQRYDFSKLTQKDITDNLSAICKKESILADEEALSLIADLADGGMRDALSILDQCAAYDQENLSVDSVREIYGVLEPSQFSNLIDHLNPAEADQAVAFLENMESKGMDMKRFAADLISMLKDSLLYDLAPNTPLIAPNRRQVIADSFAKLPTSQRKYLVENLMEIYNRFSYASNVMDYIETALLKAAIWEKPITDSRSYDREEKIRTHSGKSDLQFKEQSLNRDNNRQTVQNSAITEKFWKSDVSRETSQNIQNPKSEIRYSEDFLLSLLVGGSKDEKGSDTVHMKGVREYQSSILYGKYANALAGTGIVASAESYLLMNTRDEQKAALINEYTEDPKMHSFAEELFGKRKKVFAISTDDAKTLIKLFRNRSTDGTLPVAAKFDLSCESKAENTEAVQEMQKRLPELQIIND